ncbi:hypothetical protein ACGFJC_44645 [Nonomuraea fuscirosea]|uniref:hypothetical protein n=1 Tax=Nonomuraea fuscirosea TaxID=1291556 RepID=UPI0034865E31
MEIGLSILLGWALAALTLFLLVYSAIRLGLKHDRRSRLREAAHQTHMDRLTEQRSAKPWTEQDGL